VYQASTIDALVAGVYDGEMSYDSMMKHGDFGIGTFDGLDGEMLLLDGELFQIKSDGKVYRPSSTVKTPFAAVCNFAADTSLDLQAGTDFPGLKTLLAERFPNQNLFYAIKITGKFKAMLTRAVPGQKKPYPPLQVVTRVQPEFPMQNVSGTIVGFRCPPYVKGINVPGYHLHFISDDRTQGGHILSFDMISGACQVDMLDQYSLALPTKTQGFAETDLSKDRSKELEEAEQ
jgi:acetolactate decarboxylase